MSPVVLLKFSSVFLLVLAVAACTDPAPEPTESVFDLPAQPSRSPAEARQAAQERNQGGERARNEARRAAEGAPQED